MSQQFDEAPPLPREPTALNVPRAMGTAQTEDTVTELPVDAHALPPPPKFPSLTDVALPSATAAAASVNPTTSRPTSSHLSDDIAFTIERDAVAPGTGAKKVIEIGQRMWTLDDQRELDLLLSQGKDVYVPPDVTVDDISGKPSSYVLVPDEDDVKDERAVGERVVSWNHVLPAEGTDHAEPSIVVAPVPGTTSDDAQSRAIHEGARDKPDTIHMAERADEKEGDTTTRSLGPAEGATAPPPVDVSKTIFGARFLLVPVTSRRNNTVPFREPETTEIVETSTDVELRTDSAAHINVTDDYGLKGGHDAGTNDAAFLKDGSLITCGDDGRVCIWDMKERVVDSEFVPYNGEAVTMVYPLPDEEDATAKTIMTLSRSRTVRIWSVDDRQAVLLRSWQIKSSDKALYMTIPHISKEVKARAAAAAAAAAVTTTDAPELPAQTESFNTAPVVPEVRNQVTAASMSVTPAETTPVSMEDPTVPETHVTTEAPQTTAPDVEEAPTPTAAPFTTEVSEQPASTPIEATPSTGATSKETPMAASTQEHPEEEKERKRFSFTKVLSFGRSSGDRKAVAS